MRILAIYPNADGYQRIPTGLAIIMTVLQNAGHEMDLFDTTFFHESNRDNDTRERAKLVKEVESVLVPDSALGHEISARDGMPTIVRELLSSEEINQRLLEKLKQFEPGVVIVSIVEDNYRMADSLLHVVKEYNLSLPVIVGGPTPSAAPDVLIENPRIDFLVQGEGEEAILEICDIIVQNSGDFRGVRNLWYKVEGQVYNNQLRQFINMDTLPIQNIELWDRRHFYKPYDGVLYWTGYFEMSRGCPYMCTYCVNDTIRRSLKQSGSYFRRQSPHIAVNEVRYHKEKYGLKRVVFCDDNFLAMSERKFARWSEEFKDSWMTEINLPYWITTSVEFINPRTLQLLVDTGCDGIGIGVEVGGEWFRKNILKRRQTNEFMKKAFDMIHDYGIRTTANIMMGFPGECEEDIFESVKLIKYIQPKSFDVSLVAPYVGTEIHRAAAKLGLIDVFDKPGFKGMSTDVSFRQYFTIRNTNISPERLVELYDSFTDYTSGKLQIPEKYRDPVLLQGDRRGKNRNKESLTVADIIRKVPIEVT